MDSEIKSLKKNDTWQIVERPKNKKVIDVNWVYKKKRTMFIKLDLLLEDSNKRNMLKTFIHL